MSAELIVWDFVCRLSSLVRSGPYAQTLLEILKKKCIFLFFHDFFSIFINMGRSGSKNFKMLLILQITFESFQTFSKFSSQWSS